MAATKWAKFTHAVEPEDTCKSVNNNIHLACRQIKLNHLPYGS